MFLGHYKHMLCLVYTVGYKEKSLVCSGRNRLTGNNHMYVSSVTLSLEATCSFLSFISRYLATKTAQYETHLNRAPTCTSTQQVYDVTSICTYMNTVATEFYGILWQLSACANMQCVPGVTSLTVK